jgi:ribosome-associated heat shock protein Hsp15
MLLDSWLWAVRIYKTRTLATQAIRGGHVKIDGAAVKPAHEVRPGAVIAARVHQMTRTVRVVAAPESRVGARLVPHFLEELTPPEEFARRREVSLLPPGFRPRGAGRPTKKQRRARTTIRSRFEV